MSRDNRDEFTQYTKDTLAKRAGYRCSNPNCRRTTVGPNSNSEKSSSIGEAAHIKAAAPRGPRYDAAMTEEERKSVNNGIWLCKNCAKLIDVDPGKYTVEVLTKWKHEAELRAEKEISTRQGDSTDASAWGNAVNASASINPEADKPQTALAVTETAAEQLNAPVARDTEFEKIMGYAADNRKVYDELKKYVINNRIVPFVGAGMSVPIYPLWGSSLETIAEKLTDKSDKKECLDLLKQEKYLEAAQYLEDKRTPTNLGPDLAELFAPEKLSEKAETIRGMAVWLLPKLFKELVVTTNLDRMLEYVYKEQNSEFNKELLPGDRDWLLNGNLRRPEAHDIYKFHGTVEKDGTLDYGMTVFTERQYQEHYKEDASVKNTIREFFDKKPLLFLGCSLKKDKTLDVLYSELKPGQSNYAIVPCAKKNMGDRIRELGNLGIRAIYYPENDHAAVRIILEQLTKEFDQQGKMTTPIIEVLPHERNEDKDNKKELTVRGRRKADSDLADDKKLKKREKTGKQGKDKNPEDKSDKHKLLRTLGIVAGVAALLIVVWVVISHAPRKLVSKAASGSIIDPPSVTSICQIDISGKTLEGCIGNSLIYRSGSRYGLIRTVDCKDSGAVYASINKIYDCGSCVAVSKNKDSIKGEVESVNRYGLMREDGKLLLEEEWAKFWTLNSRYIVAYKALRKTAEGTGMIRVANQDFKAQWIVVDVEEGMIVPGVEGMKYGYFWEKGDLFSYRADDGVDHWCLPSGAEPPQSADLLDNGSYVITEPSRAAVLRVDGSEVFSFDPNQFSVRYVPEGYCAVQKDAKGKAKWTVLNDSGELCSAGFSQINSMILPYVRAYKAGGGYDLFLYYQDGTLLYNKECRSIMSASQLGRNKEAVLARLDGDNYSVYDGDKSALLEISWGGDYYVLSDQFAFAKKTFSSTTYYCFADGDFTIEGTAVGAGLISQQNAGGAYDLIDTFSGETVLRGYEQYYVYCNGNHSIVVAVFSKGANADVFMIS